MDRLGGGADRDDIPGKRPIGEAAETDPCQRTWYPHEGKGTGIWSKKRQGVANICFPMLHLRSPSAGEGPIKSQYLDEMCRKRLIYVHIYSRICKVMPVEGEDGRPQDEETFFESPV